MKKETILPKYIIFVIVIFMALAFFVFLHNKPEIAKDNSNSSEYPTIPAEELFVPIQVDTLDLYLKKYFNRGELKTKNSGTSYSIEYNPNALILLHANNNKMVEARKYLESAKVEDFSISYKGNKVKIIMGKHDGYVDCPALIAAEILRKLNEQ